MDCVSGFWSSRVEEDSPSTSQSWKSPAECPKCPGRHTNKMEEGAVHAPPFPKGSYRKYMNQLMRGNSDTEIIFERNLVKNEKYNRSPTGMADPKRALRSVNTDPNINETSLSEFGLPLNRLHELPKNSAYLTSVLPYKKYSVINRKNKNRYCEQCKTDVFCHADRSKLRNVCSASSSTDLVGSWQERYKSASDCSIHTASTETLVGYDECAGSDDVKGRNVIVRRTGLSVNSDCDKMSRMVLNNDEFVFTDRETSGSVTRCEQGHGVERDSSQSEAVGDARSVDRHVRGGRQRRTGLATAPNKQCNLPGFPRVDQLIQKYTLMIEKQLNDNQPKLGKKNIGRSSLPNLEKTDIDSDLMNVRKLSLCFDSEPEKEMGSAKSVPSITSPTYLALPKFHKNKKRNVNSPSNVSDEGCSVAPPAREGSSCSSEEDAGWSRGDHQSRCVSSDSAVEFMYGSEDEKSASCSAEAGVSIPSDHSFFGDDSFLKSSLKLKSDRWFIEHYGSSVLERCPDRSWEEGECCSEADIIDCADQGRRESSLSCFTDDDEHPGYRYFRTPSVVVSDHSDDPAFASSSITLEEIERFREEYRHRQSLQGDSSSECSAASSWSNIHSSISALDADYILRTPERKASDCSTCSTLSGDEDISCEPLQDVRPRNKPSGWRKLRNIVQWTPFFQTYKKQRYPWVQLAGHQGNFKAGPEPGTILKKLCPKEQLCFQVLMKDVLRPYVPEYKGHITCEDNDATYLQLQDLLGEFTNPCVMDCKIGVRTYLEEELAKAKEKPKLRKDMYEKMIQIDSNAPTDEEHRLKGVTKPRYMVWRETISSTATLGFRIEGIKKSDGKSSKDFKTTKTRDQIIEAFKDFTDGFPHAVPKYIQRLKAIKATLEISDFFTTHEVIGSSLLFVHDQNNANVWLIDFAKTLVLPNKMEIDHNSSWVVGNHEDGYLIGVNNLIDIFTEVTNLTAPTTVPTTLVVTAPQDVT